MARMLCSRSAVLARRLGTQPQHDVVLSRRHNHTRQCAVKVLEEDAAGPSAPATDASEQSRRLEEAIDSAMARMAEPDWAPFQPGTSYFVPSRPADAALGVLALIGHAGSSWAPRQRRGTDSLPTWSAPSPPPPAGTRARPTSSKVSDYLGYPLRYSDVLNSELKHVHKNF
ncbi:hypothetical protein ZEAMMB73_Zm00001d028743 [Zea mays]|jgi:hypothetical protein|uniref:Uncharacterized protein n=1 Tax=Zea mays TaxID=4577 RepID=A0A1D6JZ56_MAIZE|nr:hypothetical protein ZEAMMB73_Zm00001d028743 [Zea mays]